MDSISIDIEGHTNNVIILQMLFFRTKQDPFVGGCGDTLNWTDINGTYRNTGKVVVSLD